MEDLKMLFLNVLSEDAEEDVISIVSELNTILKNTGVEFNYRKSKTDTSTLNILEIRTDEEKINKSLKRHAGRKRISSRLKYSEIEEMQKSMTADEIVSKLNMSRATYFRKCKKMKQMKGKRCIIARFVTPDFS